MQHSLKPALEHLVTETKMKHFIRNSGFGLVILGFISCAGSVTPPEQEVDYTSCNTACNDVSDQSICGYFCQQTNESKSMSGNICSPASQTAYWCLVMCQSWCINGNAPPATCEASSFKPSCEIGCQAGCQVNSTES